GSSRRSWTPVGAATRASRLGLTAPSCCRGCGFCWSVPPRTGRWDGPVSTATVVLGHDGVGIPLGQVVLVGEPVGPVRELEQTGSFVDSCEPLVESLPGHLRDAFDEFGVDLR